MNIYTIVCLYNYPYFKSNHLISFLRYIFAQCFTILSATFLYVM